MGDGEFVSYLTLRVLLPLTHQILSKAALESPVSHQILSKATVEAPLNADSLGQHHEIARCIEGIGEHDLAMATRTMAGALHILQRDLLIASVREELVQKKKACAFLH